MAIIMEAIEVFFKNVRGILYEIPDEVRGLFKR
jgi:hypothetical protein